MSKLIDSNKRRKGHKLKQSYNEMTQNSLHTINLVNIFFRCTNSDEIKEYIPRQTWYKLKKILGEKKWIKVLSTGKGVLFSYEFNYNKLYEYLFEHLKSSIPKNIDEKSNEYKIVNKSEKWIYDLIPDPKNRDIRADGTTTLSLNEEDDRKLLRSLNNLFLYLPILKKNAMLSGVDRKWIYDMFKLELTKDNFKYLSIKEKTFLKQNFEETGMYEELLSLFYDYILNIDQNDITYLTFKELITLFFYGISMFEIYDRDMIDNKKKYNEFLKLNKMENKISSYTKRHMNFCREEVILIILSKMFEASQRILKNELTMKYHTKNEMNLVLKARKLFQKRLEWSNNPYVEWDSPVFPDFNKKIIWRDINWKTIYTSIKKV